MKMKKALLGLRLGLGLMCGLILIGPYQCFSEMPAPAQAALTSDTTTAKTQFAGAVYELGRALGKNINRDLLSQKIESLPQGLLYEPNISRILSAVREQGLFLIAFKLNPDSGGLAALKNHGRPFIAYLKGEGYCLVSEISQVPQGYFIRYSDSSAKSRLVDAEAFLKLWNGHIFSLPLVNVLAERIRSRDHYEGRFIAIYSYHRENFDKLRKVLEDLREQAMRLGKKLVYVDELGLIPVESVKNMQESSKLSEKEAFESSKKSLGDEVRGFEKGISVYDENPFYQAQYSYLANNKIKSYMEDLDYENWKRIVAFDNLNIHNEAIRAFCLGDIETYLNKLKEYTKGFWLYNVKERDEIFRKQINNIAKENPKEIIFTLRGIGHLGTEEKLELKDFTIETMVIADGDFNDNLVSDQMSQVLLSNGVNIEPREERLLHLRSFPEECIRAYLQRTIEDLALATRMAKKVVDRMNEEEIKRLSRDISYAFAKGNISNADHLWDYVYTWAKDRGKIISEEMPSTIVK
jgi:hypothetical protein